MPFYMMKRMAKRGECDIRVIEEDGFAGFAVLFAAKNVNMLAYFAITPEKRDRGMGSQVIKELISSGEGRLLVEIERPDKTEQKSKRKEFYLKNGMRETGLFVTLFGVDMEVLVSEGSINFEEYLSLYEDKIGKRAKRKIKQIR